MTTPNATPQPDDRLTLAVLARSAADPGLVGHWLAKDRPRRNLSPLAQADALNIPFHKLGTLALCRTPRLESFADDIRAIADLVGVSPAALAGVLNAARRADAWAVLPAADAAAAGQWLIAAHDADQPAPHADFPSADERAKPDPDRPAEGGS